MAAIAEAIEADGRQLDRHGEIVALGPNHAIRLRAATAVLDRTGMGPTSSTNINLAALQHLAELIAELDG